jgi:hypothetical protein
LGTSELVARFIYSSSRISVTKGRIKPAAFDPPPDAALSVVHSTGLLDAEVWETGLLTLSSQSGRSTIYGRADIPVKVLADQALKAILDNKPFPRHTSVIGWPTSSDENERKSLTKLICLRLSEDPSIKLVCPDTPIKLS